MLFGALTEFLRFQIYNFAIMELKTLRELSKFILAIEG